DAAITSPSTPQTKKAKIITINALKNIPFLAGIRRSTKKINGAKMALKATSSNINIPPFSKFHNLLALSVQVTKKQVIR
ncbi:hypothetical protein R0J90_16860, partial [Micrococcus sp. SIMBA_144]